MNNCPECQPSTLTIHGEKNLRAEIETLLAEIKDNNKTYRMAQDRANNDIETLTAENKRLVMMLDEYVRLDNAGKIPMEPVGGSASTQQDQFTIRKYIADKTFTMAPGETLDEFYARGVKSGYLREVTDSASTQQTESDGKTDAAEKGHGSG